ncbi:hypothetical protein [Streptosporangium saharense]|uniref:hypothetical protein n=1 Tax=Streptosporangium saharense TaxID=1706840 RepID=UPI0033328B07
MAAVLYGWAMGSLGYGDSSYAAAVRSMGVSRSNFSFGAFDPLGVSVGGEPPGALSARVFGYRGWALILPQVVEGVLDELRRLVAAGDLWFVRLSGFTGQGAGADRRPAWTEANCSPVTLEGVTGLRRCDAQDVRG